MLYFDADYPQEHMLELCKASAEAPKEESVPAAAAEAGTRKVEDMWQKRKAELLAFWYPVLFGRKGQRY